MRMLIHQKQTVSSVSILNVLEGLRGLLPSYSISACIPQLCDCSGRRATESTVQALPTQALKLEQDPTVEQKFGNG